MEYKNVAGKKIPVGKDAKEYGNGVLWHTFEHRKYVLAEIGQSPREQENDPKYWPESELTWKSDSGEEQWRAVAYVEQLGGAVRARQGVEIPINMWCCSERRSLCVLWAKPR